MRHGRSLRRYGVTVGLKLDKSANFFTLLAVLSRYLCSEDSFKSVCIRIFSVRNYLSPQRLLPRTAPIIVFIITGRRLYTQSGTYSARLGAVDDALIDS
jgi:hypothetical protein